MEDKDALILKLQKEINARDEEVHLAAKYGKQLLDDNTKLSAKVDELLLQKEKLEQEKHSLQLDLERQIQAVTSQTNEVELQREQIDSLTENLQVNEKENDALQKKTHHLAKENDYLKKMQDELTIQNGSLKEKFNVLLKQLSNFEDQAEKSMNETYKDDCQELQSQLNTYILNNKELQNALSQCQCELEVVKKNENHLLQIVKELEETVDEKNSEISAYQEEMKKAKEEIEELQGDIEILKYDQIDVNKRGNSVFAELDDRRTMVEREYKTLRKKYELFQKDYEKKKEELDRARGQMAILQSMTSREHQQTYIDSLEDSLLSARKEINDLTHKLAKALKVNEDASVVETSFAGKQGYDYLRIMLEQSQKKEKELQTEVVNLKTKNMYDNDELVKMHQRLYKAKDDLDKAKQEIFKLKQEIKELQLGVMHNLPEEQIRKPRIEIVEGFKPLPKEKENTKLLNQSIFTDLPDFDTIPGELELGEDGFKQVKPPRKSNKFILQEFNKVEPKEEHEEAKTISKKSDAKLGEQSILEVEKRKSTHNTNRSRPSKNRTECAQQ